MSMGNQYTDEEILDALREHAIKKLLSKYSMYKPTWQGILKRMAKDEEFAAKVNSIENEAMAKWESVGLKALMTSDAGFNTQLYKMFVGNKKPFLEHSVLSLEDAPEKSDRPSLTTHIVASIEEYELLQEKIKEE